MTSLEILTYKPIDIPGIMTVMNFSESGGIVTFCGIVRNNNHGRNVKHLEYEAYEPMAKKKILEIAADAANKWKLTSALCIHRLGKLEISECAIFILTCSAHRAEAYEANRYIIEKVKKEVPIWKREFYTDGTSGWGKN
jgi:molybdopterin synthase catalytic subunit